MNTLSKKDSLDLFIDFLASRKAVILGALLGIVAQLWHAIDAYVKISFKMEALDYSSFVTWFTLILGVSFAIALSFGILVMTVRGRVKMAYFFLLVEVFVNLIHFGLTGTENWVLLSSTIFMCIINPICIAAYSHEAAEEEKESDYIEFRKEEVPGPGAVNPSKEEFIEANVEEDDQKEDLDTEKKNVDTKGKELEKLARSIQEESGVSIDVEDIDESQWKKLRDEFETRKSLSKRQFRNNINKILEQRTNGLFS